MIYHWWNRGVSWGLNNSQIKGVQISDPNLNPNLVKLGQIEVQVGVELGLKLKVELEVFEPPYCFLPYDIWYFTFLVVLCLSILLLFNSPLHTNLFQVLEVSYLLFATHCL